METLENFMSFLRDSRIKKVFENIKSEDYYGSIILKAFVILGLEVG